VYWYIDWKQYTRTNDILVCYYNYRSLGGVSLKLSDYIYLDVMKSMYMNDTSSLLTVELI